MCGIIHDDTYHVMTQSRNNFARLSPFSYCIFAQPLAVISAYPKMLREMDDIDTVRTLKKRDLIKLCSERKGDIISHNENGAKVLQLSSRIAVKFGLCVNRQEAANQDQVFRSVDLQKLYVPGVLRFFEDNSLSDPLIVNYLIMKFVEGINMAEITAAEQTRFVGQIADAIRALYEMPLPTDVSPGPVGGGMPRGHLWPDCGAENEFDSVRNLEHWLNTRLLSSKRFGYEAVKLFDLNAADIAMCHLDIVPRNLIVMPDGRICFVDWAYAGFFPLFFKNISFTTVYLMDLTSSKHCFMSCLLKEC